MSGDFYKEWRTYAEVDYFSQFILLWLSTNAWYRSHYAEITSRKDRDFLEKLRQDHSPRNKLYSRFERAISSPSIDLPPTSRTTVNERSPSTQENDGHEEEQIQRRTGHRVSRISRPGRAGCTRSWSSTCSRGASSAGRLAPGCERASCP